MLDFCYIYCYNNFVIFLKICLILCFVIFNRKGDCMKLKKFISIFSAAAMRIQRCQARAAVPAALREAPPIQRLPIAITALIPVLPSE